MSFPVEVAVVAQTGYFPTVYEGSRLINVSKENHDSKKKLDSSLLYFLSR